MADTASSITPNIHYPGDELMQGGKPHDTTAQTEEEFYALPYK